MATLLLRIFLIINLWVVFMEARQGIEKFSMQVEKDWMNVRVQPAIQTTSMTL